MLGNNYRTKKKEEIQKNIGEGHNVFIQESEGETVETMGNRMQSNHSYIVICS